MTKSELDHIARLIDERAIELDGIVFDRRPSSVDVELCNILAYATTIPEQAACIARIAAAYRGLDPASPTIERDAKTIAGIRRGFSLPKALRERLPELCALPVIAPQPKPARRRDDRPAIERLEDAVANERRKPYAEQRHALVRKWLEELEALRDTHDDIYATA